MFRLRQATRGSRYSKTTSNDWWKAFAGRMNRSTENRFYRGEIDGMSANEETRIGGGSR